MRRRTILAIILAVAPAAAIADAPLRLDVIEHRFPNGLTLLMLEHRQAPIVSCSVFYRVGSANEQPGMTGISHLLEHMMFKGTQAIGTRDYSLEAPLLGRAEELRARLDERAREGGGGDAPLAKKLEETERRLDALRVENELWKIYMRNGAVGLNANTGRDRTQYLCSLPANRLELWMWLESDRMRNAVFREFHREKAVILEERRLSVDDSPGGAFYEQLFATAFIAHPYRWPIIGWRSDIENITLPMLEAYYRRYYAPNNAIVVVAGDIRPAEVIAMAARYFGPIPSRQPPPPIVTREPVQRGIRQVSLDLSASPRIALAFHAPAVSDDDGPALDVLENILSSGRTSRLYRGLVQRARIAVSADVSYEAARYPFLMIFDALPRQPHTVDEVSRALWEEIGRVSREGAGEWEMQKARNQIEAGFVRGLESASALAGLVGTYEAIDRWQYLNGYIPRIRAVTAADVMRVARRYLTEDNCTRVVISSRARS